MRSVGCNVAACSAGATAGAWDLAADIQPVSDGIEGIDGMRSPEQPESATAAASSAVRRGGRYMGDFRAGNKARTLADTKLPAAALDPLGAKTLILRIGFRLGTHD